MQTEILGESGNIELPAIANILQDNCLIINNYSDNSEQEFLEIGSRLQTYLSAARELSSVSSRILTSFSSDNLQKGTADLNLLLNKFGVYFSHSAAEVNSDKEELQSISSLVSSISEGSDWLKKIVKHLTMLGISTKIESSRLGEFDNGFLVLADNVDRLAGLIKDKANVIIKKSLHLIGETVKTTKSLASLEVEQRKHADIILDKISSSLLTFEQKLNDCFRKIESINSGADNVGRNIYEIVTSVQFHDITRQQLEHIVEASSELAANINDRDPNLPVTDDDYGMVHDICDLQFRQLNNTAKEFDTAVSTIISNLQSVANNIAAIYSESDDLFKDRNSKNESSLLSVQNQLNIISEGVKKNIEIESQLAESINHVVNIVDDLSGFVLEIEDIGSEIELLALNALVKAAHTEINGSALSVLAQEIQKLSIDAKVHTSFFSGILENITATSKKLRINISKSDDLDETNNLFSTNNEITNLLTSMIFTEKESEEMISKINSDIKTLKDEIETAASNITIHKKADAFFSEISFALKSIVDTLRNNTGLIPNKGQNTADLMKKYSMQIERDIHLNHSASDDKTKFLPESDNTNPDAFLFGDDVELF